jgi:hypothetical protein
MGFDLALVMHLQRIAHPVLIEEAESAEASAGIECRADSRSSTIGFNLVSKIAERAV